MKSILPFTISAVIFLFPAVIFHGCKTTSMSSKGLYDGREIVLRLEPGPENPRNSEGDFITLRNGRILFIYSHFAGASGGDFGNAYLASRYSDDKGKTWSQKDEKVVGQEGDMNVMSISLLRLQNGEIALFYARKNSASDCIPMMRISTDEAKTWSDPVQCITDRKEYFVLNNDRVVQLKNGRLLMPVSLHISPGGVWGPSSAKGMMYCYISDDNGRNWKAVKEVPNPEDIILQEPGVIELKNGDILMFMRTGEGVQYVSYSKDSGETWSPASRGNIISPRSPASIERIPSTGDLLLVWNNNGTDQKRTPFNIAVSKDEGKTWENMKILEDDPDGWYCYTAIHFTKKNVLLGHCAGNRPKGTSLAVTQITRLDLDWIYK
ncbi:MAG TPA: sialidase [Bacteroidales bacterium]|nr:sialidase [Bacteroidales bacterium]